MDKNFLHSLPLGVTVSGQNVILKKKFYDIEDLQMAKVFGFKQEENSIVVDVCATSKTALYYYLKGIFPVFMTDDRYKTARETVFKDIKSSYDSMFKIFNEESEVLVPYYKRLFEHQKEGVYFGVHRKHNFLAFEQGLGKTITSATISVLSEQDVTIVLTPAACKWNWKEDLTNFGFDVEQITVLDSKRRFIGKREKFIIVNYDIFEKSLSYIYDKYNGKKIHLICDEAHKIKNKDAQRTKSVKVFVANTRCKVTFLSGTPAPNTIVDIFSSLNIIGHETGNNYKNFLKSYVEFQDTRFGMKINGVKNLGHLSKMICNFMLRKTKTECLDLPEKIYTKLLYDLDDYQHEYLEALKAYEMARTNKNKDSKMALHSLNIITAKSKVSKIKDLVESITSDCVKTEDGRERTKKVVIFSSYSEPIKMIESTFQNLTLKIDGSTESHKRLDIVNEFKKSDEIKILVANITAAGIGLNIVDETITDIIFLNFPFTQAELDQAIDRLHRIGQKNVINIYYTVCADSIDEKLYRLLTKKYKDTSTLVDGKYNEIELTEENICDVIDAQTKIDF